MPPLSGRGSLLSDGRLVAPRGWKVRPTSDRVREAIFSALDARGLITGARVLDLYSGSGALGLEAASRGASHVTLVDRANAASKIGTDNAERVQEMAGEWQRWAKRVSVYPAPDGNASRR